MKHLNDYMYIVAFINDLYCFSAMCFQISGSQLVGNEAKIHHVATFKLEKKVKRSSSQIGADFCWLGWKMILASFGVNQTNSLGRFSVKETASQICSHCIREWLVLSKSWPAWSEDYLSLFQLKSDEFEVVLWCLGHKKHTSIF